MTRVLFVCLGNICRSPTAEAAFRAAAPQMLCDSAGTSDWHLGDPPYTPMQNAAKARGISMNDLRARQFNPQDFEAFDLILGMDDENITKIEALRPEGSETQVKLLTDYGTRGETHVPDPYYTQDFEECLDIVEDAIAGLVKALA